MGGSLCSITIDLHAFQFLDRIPIADFDHICLTEQAILTPRTLLYSKDAIFCVGTFKFCLLAPYFIVTAGKFFEIHLPSATNAFRILRNCTTLVSTSANLDIVHYSSPTDIPVKDARSSSK